MNGTTTADLAPSSSSSFASSSSSSSSPTVAGGEKLPERRNPFEDDDEEAEEGAGMVPHGGSVIPVSPEANENYETIAIADSSPEEDYYNFKAELHSANPFAARVEKEQELGAGGAKQANEKLKGKEKEAEEEEQEEEEEREGKRAAKKKQLETWFEVLMDGRARVRLEFDNARVLRDGKPILYNFRDLSHVTHKLGEVRLRQGVLFRSASWARSKAVDGQDVAVLVQFWREVLRIRTIVDLRSENEKTFVFLSLSVCLVVSFFSLSNSSVLFPPLLLVVLLSHFFLLASSVYRSSSLNDIVEQAYPTVPRPIIPPLASSSSASSYSTLSIPATPSTPSSTSSLAKAPPNQSSFLPSSQRVRVKPTSVARSMIDMSEHRKEKEHVSIEELVASDETSSPASSSSITSTASSGQQRPKFFPFRATSAPPFSQQQLAHAPRFQRYSIDLVTRNLRLKGLMWSSTTSDVYWKMVRSLFGEGTQASKRIFVEQVMNKIGLVGFTKLMLIHSREDIARALRICSNPQNHPVMFHCVSGKDRTGLVAALLLSICEVEREVIVEDYYLSEVFLSFVMEEIVQDNREKGLCEKFDGTPKEFMHELLDWIDDEWGSVRTFLHSACGFTYSEQDVLRNVLLEKTG
ncbi:Tyrosine-protein phosphatase [Balamuthia mandrillaris]